MSRVLRYDLEELPKPPFSVYFLNDDGEIWPKQAYTITGKRINDSLGLIQIRVSELDQWVEYNRSRVQCVKYYMSVN